MKVKAESKVEQKAFSFANAENKVILALKCWNKMKEPERKLIGNMLTYRKSFKKQHLPNTGIYEGLPLLSDTISSSELKLTKCCSISI